MLIRHKLAIATSLVCVQLTACKVGGETGKHDQKSGLASSAANTKAAQESDDIRFNLASYARTNPKMKDLGKIVAPGDAYLGLGDKKTFLVQTNVTADGELPAGSAPRVLAGMWVNASVFNLDLGAKSKLIEVTAESKDKNSGIVGTVRYQGQEKFKKPLTHLWDQTFTRSMEGDAVVPTPIPGLGVKFSGNIGGEFGGKIDPSVRTEDALRLSFVPRVGLVAGIAGGVSALSFASAQGFGSVTILETRMAHYAALGVHRDLGIAAGGIGIEDGDMTWLSGQLGIRAETGLDVPGLPPGVNAALWTLVRAVLPGVKDSYEYTLWKPDPINISKLPSFANYARRLIQKPMSGDECNTRLQQMTVKVQGISRDIEKDVLRMNEEYQKDPKQTLLDQMQAAATVKTNYQEALGLLDAECAMF